MRAVFRGWFGLGIARYFASRKLLRKHGRRVSHLSHTMRALTSPPSTPDKGEHPDSPTTGEDGGGDDGGGRVLSAPDRENVFVFETVLIMCSFSDFA